MKVKWESNSEETKLLEEKRKEINKLINLNNISIKENLTLLINGWCAEHIKTLHKEYPSTEWLAICKIEPQGSWTFLMTDMIFPWQKGVGGEVETTEEWMKRLTQELIDRWEDLKKWNCVLHSHHSMGCFWSWTDNNARLSLNDWRQMAWAVVSSYDKEGNINYKGCVNFYKPYNIEIDATVKPISDISIVEKYEEYLEKVAESEASFYEFLLEENKDYIDKITEQPSYDSLLDYLDLDITEELNANYEKIKDKIWNPQLLDYIKQLENKAHELAVSETNTGGIYTDMLIEYGAFCDWSDNLLTQLEEHRQKPTTFGALGTFGSSISSISYPYDTNAYPTNRNFDDNDYEFTAPKYSESNIRQMFGIDYAIPMKIGDENEWLAWCEEYKDYLYVEYWAEDYRD